MSRDFDSLPDATLVAHANDALQRDDLDTAIVALTALMRRHPGNAALMQRLATLHNNRGSRHARAGALGAAAADWDESLRLAPDQLPARVNRGRLHAGERQWRDAVTQLSAAHALAPDDTEVTLELADARAFAGFGDAPATIAALRDAITAASAARSTDALRLAMACATIDDAPRALAYLDAAPSDTPAPRWLEVAQRWREAGDATMAPRVFSVARARGVGDLRAEIGARLALPLIYRDLDEIAAARAAFAQGLDALRDAIDPDDARSHTHALDELLWSNQSLALQGHDDRALLSSYGDWLSAMSARLAPAIVRDGPLPRRAGTARIALVLPTWRDTAMTAYFGAWVEALPDTGASGTLVALDPRRDATSDRLAARCAETLVLSGDLATMAATLHAAAFDVILYAEAAVDPRVHLLASLRLARVQMAGWGHPQTTGLPTLDAFITCAAMEPADNAHHYRERLIALPQLGTRYSAPPVADADGLRAISLPAGNRYLVPHIAGKLHPDLDAVLGEIVARDPLARLLFVGIERPALRERLRSRFDVALRAVGATPEDYVHFLPRVPHPVFIALAQACAVMLDPPHWSGGANAYDALASGLPLVTTPGQLMRGRQSMAMARVLGVDDALVVASTDAIAERAVAIATDEARRAAIVEKLRANRDALFAADDASRTLANHVRALAD